jgi:hypothetical protein
VTRPYHRATDHKATAAQARLKPGKWITAGVYRNHGTAESTASQIRTGKIATYARVGAFQAQASRHEDGYALWVRLVDARQALAPVPDTMTVRLRHDGDGPGKGVGVLTVTVSTRCPLCGAPRGYDTIQPKRFRHDGETYEVDVWDNPCGHIDLHPHVLAESRQQDPAQERVGLLEPVRLVLQACGEGRLTHARHAADLLAEHGYADEAAVIRAQSKDRRGHMSAKQAAEYLRDLAGGGS